MRLNLFPLLALFGVRTVWRHHRRLKNLRKFPSSWCFHACFTSLQTFAHAYSIDSATDFGEKSNCDQKVHCVRCKWLELSRTNRGVHYYNDVLDSLIFYLWARYAPRNDILPLSKNGCMIGNRNMLGWIVHLVTVHTDLQSSWSSSGSLGISALRRALKRACMPFRNFTRACSLE